MPMCPIYLVCPYISYMQNLTGGTAFYFSTDKEQCSEYRKIVLRNKETKEYIDDFTSRNKGTILSCISEGNRKFY